MRALIILLVLASAALAIAQPAPSADGDGDGIADSADKCPSEGANPRCPSRDGCWWPCPDTTSACAVHERLPSGACPKSKPTPPVGAIAPPTCSRDCPAAQRDAKGCCVKAPPPGAGRPSAATPPSGYRCGPGGKLVLNKGCTCAAGRKETRDADDVAVCVKTTATRPPPDERRPPTPGPGPGPLPTPKPGPLPTPGELRVSIGQMTGDPGGYTEAEIMRVVRARVGTVRACYQKELTRAPGLQGKLIVKLKIADGKVAAASATSSTLANAAIESCVRFNFQRLVFPAKTAGADVAIPIVFTST